MTVPVVLSGSSLSTFLECPHEWLLRYVWRVPERRTWKLARGSAAHTAVELYMKRGKITPLAQVLTDYEMELLVEAVGVPENEKKRETFVDYLVSGRRALEKFHHDVAPHIAPAMVEQAIQFTINGVPYSGSIDLVDDADIIHDWKFASRDPEDASRYVFNMIGYAIGFRRLTGRLEGGMIVDYIVCLKRDPVRHIPITSGPISDDSIRSFADTVERSAESIAAGKFPPLGMRNGTCNYCSVRAHCVYNPPKES